MNKPKSVRHSVRTEIREHALDLYIPGLISTQMSFIRYHFSIDIVCDIRQGIKPQIDREATDAIRVPIYNKTRVLEMRVMILEQLHEALK